jgi:2-dehydro-3-deoxyphosphogluconate aldolase / (4S)-4-hydroxy-2-oxoglutarate aldolase
VYALKKLILSQLKKIMADRQTTVVTQIKSQGILPLFYNDDMAVCIQTTLALYAAGVRCIEFTNRGANAVKNFAALVKERDTNMPGLLLGIGTIKTGEEAATFIDAGADFLISPVFDSTVFDTAYMNKILWIPGCMTPTEIHAAQQAGCNIVKLFPGNVLGPDFVAGILPLFAGMDFIVTGGVDTTEANITAWFKSGVCAVGMGSKLITNAILQTGNYDKLQLDTQQVLAIINKIKK